MLEVVTGPFHPALENEFVKRLRLAKKDPLTPVIIVAPSRRLAARLKELALEAFPRGVAGLHVHNLYSFARELYGDAAGSRLMEDDLLHEKLLLDLIQKHFADSTYLARALHAGRSGRAILGAIKDLRDGGVDPAAALELLKEGGLGGESVRKLAELLSLYARYLEALESRKIHGRPDVVRVAERNIGRIAGRRVFYYGFYELVQTQIDLFRAVSRECETTLFYPFVAGDPDFAFAQDFFDTVVRGSARSIGEHRRRSPVKPALITASGARDEIWACAKWILEMRGKGVPFHGIGVVARTLDPYLEHVESIFRDHAIPFSSSASHPVERDPRLVAAKALLDLADGGFRRDEVMDVVASPSFRRDPKGDPILWDLATRYLGIGRGRDEWEKRLGAFAGRDFVHTAGRRGDERKFVMEAAQVDLLLACVRGLFERAHPPASAGWAERVRWARSLFAEFLQPDPSLDETLDSLAALEEILPPPSAAEFRDLFRARLSGLDRPAGTENIPGVQVLDAMAARGLPFRALAVIGMNERVFPRYILEDPFVTDGVRQQLHHRLGNRLPVKVRGYDEERLLFALLRDAAGEDLLLSWQRSDDRGRVQVPSIFLEGFAPGDPVPRRPKERLEKQPADRLTPREAILRAELAGGNGLPAARGLAGVTGLEASGLAEALRFLDGIERARGPGACDGLLGSGVVPRSGALSPTALETFVTCPFKYFSEKALGLEALEEPEAEESTSAMETGLLYHAVLEAHYQGKAFEQALAEGYADFEKTRTIRYPLLWEAERKRIRGVLEAFIRFDLENRGAFRPAHFEQRVEGELAGVKFAGYADRIDLAGRAFRVIDYKRSASKYGVSMETGVFKHGRYVQPPLYFLLAAEFLKRGGMEPLLDASTSGYLFLDDDEKRELWLPADFAARSGDWVAILKRIVDAIAGGRFVLKDGAHCAWCDFHTMCRKSHLPTRMRAGRFHEAGPSAASSPKGAKEGGVR